MVTRRYSFDLIRALFPSLAAASLLLGSFVPALSAQQQQPAARMMNAAERAEAVDVGPVPVSQPMRLTLRLAPRAERAAALDRLLADQTTASSPAYHHWITPQQFAANYGVTDEQLAATTGWLESQGLTVDAVSPARTRLSVSGTADRVQRVFAVSLHNYVASGTQRYASTALPSMPLAVSSNVAEISGLDNLAATAKTTVTTISAAGLTAVLSNDATDPLDAAAAAIDANAAPILTITTANCTSAQSAAEYEAYRALFRQASAQGITVVTSNACAQSAATQTGNLADTTAIVTAPGSAVAAADPRPAWQAAPGLPNDALRHTPDLTTSSVEDFTHALTAILQQSGGRQGNINARLYSLASTPGLYAQPDGASGTWEPATGLGTVNLQTLAKVFPRATGALPTTITLTSNATTTLAGINFTLTATVSTSASNSVGPTGNVVFYDNFNGAVAQLGSTTSVMSNGPNQSIAFFSTTGLPAGVHSIYAVYSGDANFTTSTSSALAVSVQDFTITKVPQTLTLKAGQTGKAVLLLGIVGGFNGTVTFGCTPPPNTETTCTFSPLALTGGGSTTLQITTTAPTTTQAASRGWFGGTWNLFGGTALAALLWFAAPRRRAGLTRLLLLLAAVAMTANLGCGTGKTSTAPATVSDPGTPLGTLTFTITTAGSDGVNTVRHTDQYQVTIQ